ncbi:MAG: glycosyltransferase family 39 protein, partial [Melioribacteraceae bacterium]
MQKNIFSKNSGSKVNIGFITILGIFTILRLLSWSNLTVLEDHDSIQYLKLISFFKNFTFEGLLNLGADDLILYPFFGAIISWFGFSIEFSARLATFISTLILFYFVYAIGKEIWDKKVALVGVLLFAINPFLISFSYAVLTEPTYITIVYYGVLLFLKYISAPKIKSAVVLGIIFGLSFIARTEGIIFIVAIPIIQFSHYLFYKNRNYKIKDFIVWTFSFIIIFGAVVSPQILRVSNKMDTFSINGRQAWMKLLKSDIKKSNDELIYGLDYSPSKINIHAVQSNPEIYHSLRSESNIQDQIKTFVYTYDELFNIKLSSFFGLSTIVFFGFGFFYLVKRGEVFKILFVFLFLGVFLFPPLLHNVVTRHIAIIGPIIFVISGGGIYYFSKSILKNFPKFDQIKNRSLYTSIFIILIIAVLSGHSLYMSLIKPTENLEYSEADYLEPIQKLNKNLGSNKSQKHLIISRKNYFPYFAKVNSIATPYSSYKKLIEYAKLNDTKYIFIDYINLMEFPFIK